MPTEADNTRRLNKWCRRLAVIGTLPFRQRQQTSECLMPKTTYPRSPLTYLEYPFLRNKYFDIYQRIIERAQARPKPEQYTENHHALPKCHPFDGSGRKINMVHLTFKEHLIAHKCLIRITEGVAQVKMIYALNMMSNINNTTKPAGCLLRLKFRSSRSYTINKRKMIDNLKKRELSIEHLAKLRRKHTPEHIENARQGRIGIRPTPETIEKIRRKLKGRPQRPGVMETLCRGNIGRTHTAERNEKIRQRKLGIPQTPEHIEKRRQSLMLGNLRRRNVNLEIGALITSAPNYDEINELVDP